MKIAYAGNFKQVRSTEGYVADALHKLDNCSVLRLQEGDFSHTEMVRALENERQRPDVFLFSKCELNNLPFKDMMNDPKILLEFLRRVRNLGIKTVCWVFDLMRQEFSGPRFRWSQAIAEECDLFVTTDSHNLGLRNHKCLRQGCTPPGPGTSYSALHPRTPYEVVHVGEIYGARRAWHTTMSSILGRRFGVIRSAFEERLRNVCREAKIVAGPPYPYFPGYWSNRVYLIAGYGGCFVAPMIPGMQDEGWKHCENMIAAPLDHRSAAEQILHFLRDEELLRYVSANALEFVWKNHTYGHRAVQLLEWLNGLQPQGGTSDAGAHSQAGREDRHR